MTTSTLNGTRRTTSGRLASTIQRSNGMRSWSRHTRKGGAAIFAPDCFHETLCESTELLSEEDGARALRCVMWTWDPNPSDATYLVEFAFLLRDERGVRAVHDRHTEGVFPRATWLAVLESAGYRVESLKRPLGDGNFDEIFLCRRP